MNKTVLFSLVSIVLLFLTACKSKEEVVIDKLKALYERIDKDGSNYDKEQWQGVIEELQAIQKEAKECNFTPDQKKEVGQLQGKLTTLILKKGAASLGTNLMNVLKGLGSFTDGYIQGLKDNIRL